MKSWRTDDESSRGTDLTAARAELNNMSASGLRHSEGAAAICDVRDFELLSRRFSLLCVVLSA